MVGGVNNVAFLLSKELSSNTKHSSQMRIFTMTSWLPLHCSTCTYVVHGWSDSFPKHNLKQKCKLNAI